jgi:two-component system nitrate/nitrite response regulator NarL
VHAKRRIRVVVVDDQPLYRAGVERALGGAAEPGFAVVGSFGDGETGLAAIDRLRPDVALVELGLPRLDGLSLLRRASRDQLSTRIVVLTGVAQPDALYTALECGAAGYLLKDVDGPALRRAVQAVLEGEVALPRGLQPGLVSEIRSRADGMAPLTPRERDVLALAADGCTAAETAARLMVSSATVKSDLTSVYEKLRVSSRAAAVAQGMRLGLLD